jgi:hypothetical protein
MFAIRILLLKARQNKTPMDVTDRVVALCLQGEYLQRLTTELTTALAALGHALREQRGSPRVEAGGPIQVIDFIRNKLN